MKIATDRPEVVITLSRREAEQLRLEIIQIQDYARVKGPILDHLNVTFGLTGIEAAPYPGHSDVWPHNVVTEVKS